MSIERLVIASTLHVYADSFEICLDILWIILPGFWIFGLNW